MLSVYGLCTTTAKVCGTVIITVDTVSYPRHCVDGRVAADYSGGCYYDMLHTLTLTCCTGGPAWRVGLRDRARHMRLESRGCVVRAALDRAAGVVGAVERAAER